MSPARPFTLKRFPTVTLVVWLVTAGTTALQSFLPHLLPALARRPGMLAAGEWWRLFTPLFVHNDGWSQITLNLSGLAILGTLVEQRLGALRWLAVYFVPGIIGELTGLAWQPYGAGASVAVAGLMGVVDAWLVFAGLPWRIRAGAAAGLVGAIFLTARHDLHGPPLLAGFALGALMRHARRFN